MRQGFESEFFLNLIFQGLIRIDVEGIVLFLGFIQFSYLGVEKVIFLLRLYVVFKRFDRIFVFRQSIFSVE